MERKVPDAGDTAADRGTRQEVATKERLAPDAGDAAGDRDTRQAEIDVERSAPDAGDRQAIDRVRDGHHTAGSGVPRDRDRAVIGRVSKILGLHPGGQRQEQEQQQPHGAGSPQKPGVPFRPCCFAHVVSAMLFRPGKGSLTSCFGPFRSSLLVGGNRLSGDPLTA